MGGVLVVTRLLFSFFFIFRHFYSSDTINMAFLGLKGFLTLWSSFFNASLMGV
jgi:hypothetical protein